MVQPSSSGLTQDLMGLEFNQSLSVVRSIKSDDQGTTELVSSPDGSLFVRKYLRLDSSAAATYKQLEGLICPHLAQVYKVLQLGNTAVVIMEYCQGTTLRQLVESNGPLNPVQAQTYLSQLCQAASFLHACPSAPIIHRDINPSNIVIAHQSAHLIDLGIARPYNSMAVKDTKPLGTFGYAAPEQFGFAQSDVRTDVYGLGATYYFMLTGHDPSQNMAETLVYSPLPPALKQVIGKACEPQPDLRYQIVGELAAAALGISTFPHRDERTAIKQADDGERFSKSVPSIVLKSLICLVEGVLLVRLVDFSLDGFGVLSTGDAVLYALGSVFIIAGLIMGPVGLIAFIPEIYRKKWIFSQKRGKRVALILLACFILCVLGCILFMFCPDGVIQTVQAVRESQ